MPPKTRGQTVEGTDAVMDQGADGGVAEERLLPAEIPATGGDAAITALAQMFQSFMQYQKDRDERQEREASRREQNYKVLSHQVTQMQLDMERTRNGASEGAAKRVIDHEPRIAKLEDSDDIEHYLTTFERLAEVYQWPRGDWAVRLIPLLTGKARSAFVAMNPSQTRDYDQVKVAILKKYEIGAETYRLRFRSLSTPADETPTELYIRLKDLFSKWVHYEQSNKRDIMESLVLEQYLRVLYPEVRTWVKERDPDTAAEAASLVEAYIAAWKGPGATRYAGILHSLKGKSDGLGGGSNSQSGPKIFKPSHSKPPTSAIMPQTAVKGEIVICYNCGEPGHTRPLCPLKKPKTTGLCYMPRPEQLRTQPDREPVITVLLNGKPLSALVDTGCSHTLVQAQYIPRDSWSEGDAVTVCCVHGDSTELPTAEVYIEVCNQSYLMKVGVATKLPYPVLLGTDFPVLAELLQETVWCGVVTRAQAKQLTQVPQPQEITPDILQEMPFSSETSLGESRPTEQERLKKRREWVEGLLETSEQAEEGVEEPELTEADLVVPGNLAQT